MSEESISELCAIDINSDESDVEENGFLQLSKRMRLTLKKALENGSRTISGQKVAFYKWLISPDGEIETLEVIFKYVDGIPSLTFLSGDIEKTEQFEKFTCFQKAQQETIFSRTRHCGFGYQDLSVLSYKDHHVETDGEYENLVWDTKWETRKQPSGIDDALYFENVWFGSLGKVTIQAVIAKCPSPWVGIFKELAPNEEHPRGFLRPEISWENGKLAVDEEKLAAYVVAQLVWRASLAIFNSDLLPELNFPKAEDYTPRRPVDLKPDDVMEVMNDTSLFRSPLIVPWNVIEAACASLNSGKNIIFTGPPGCGKSKLAQALAVAHQRSAFGLGNERFPLIATASPAWTTSELLGGYIPRPISDTEGKSNGFRLVFRPGFFLQAAPSHRWLIVDEINRANIDACFGELFSVLAGDIAQLPFEEAEAIGMDEDSPEQTESSRQLPVRLVPPGRAEIAKRDATDHRDYLIPRAFRLIATMNDADRGQLHELSYAFQRRFNIIRVEPPEVGIIQSKIIGPKLEQLHKDLELQEKRYMIKIASRAVGVDFSGSAKLQEAISTLCANKAPNDRFRDLIQERVIGVATALDLLNFVAEECRAPTASQVLAVAESEFNELGPKDLGEELILSFLALGIVISVIPQLDSLPGDKLHDAVRHILSAFQGSHLRRITTDASEYKLKHGGLSIVDFLGKEIHSHLSASGLRDEIVWETLGHELKSETLGKLR